MKTGQQVKRGMTDTIFALSSGALPSGVAVVRISGPETARVVEALFHRLPAPRVASYGAIGADREDPIDRGLVVWFPGPKSFTGEDCAEFHLHGGRAVVAAMVASLGLFEGLRAAEAGEFSRRAFENGRMDLTAVEGLGDLIHAETEAQRRLALRQADGGVAKVLDGWRERLIRCRALIEADLDFADEEDIPGSVAESVWRDAGAIAAEMERHLVRSGRGERLRSGFEIVLLGAPNAGKSSLLNALAGRPAAIVTPEAGTTRDVIEVRLDLAGYPVTLIDTAGLREAAGVVEAEGIRRARARAAAADLVLYLVAPEDGVEPDDVPSGAWVIATKCDLGNIARRYDLAVSTVTGVGLDDLEATLGQYVRETIGGVEDLVITRARHRDGLSACVAHLKRAIAGDGLGLELRAEDLRRAADALARLTGRIDVEDLLEVIFRDFCIGK